MHPTSIRTTLLLAITLTCGCHRSSRTASVGRVTSSIPAPDALEVDRAIEIRVDLGDEVPASVQIADNSVTLTDERGAVAVSVTFLPEQRTGFLRPIEPLAPGAIHAIELRDAAGSAWRRSWNFATHDDRSWVELPLIATDTQLVPRSNGDIHAYWTDAIDVRTAVLAPGSAEPALEATIASGLLMTAGFDPNDVETVMIRTGEVAAYDRAPGGGWAAPVASPASPTGGVVNGWGAAGRAPDGTTAYFTWWQDYHFAGTFCYPYDAVAGWLPGYTWSSGQSSPSPIPPVRSARDWITASTKVEVTATVVGTDWQLQSEFPANQALALAPGADDIEPCVATNRAGQAMFAWRSMFESIAGPMWAVYATAPMFRDDIATPVLLGIGAGLPVESRLELLLAESGHAVAVLRLAGFVRTWRYDPTTDLWSAPTDLAGGPVFAVDIDATGDALIAVQLGAEVLVYRGYTALGWGPAEFVVELPSTAPTAVGLKVLHDRIGGDIVQWFAGSARLRRRV